MKKYLSALVLLIAIGLISCGGKKQESAEVDDLPIQSSEVLEISLGDEHNARTSLDYMGIYKGIIPVKDTDMEVTIVLEDSTYSLKAVIDGQKIKLENEGKYTWDETGFLVTLVGVDSPSEYRVVEGALIVEGDSISHRLDKVQE